MFGDGCVGSRCGCMQLAGAFGGGAVGKWLGLMSCPAGAQEAIADILPRDALEDAAAASLPLQPAKA